MYEVWLRSNLLDFIERKKQKGNALDIPKYKTLTTGFLIWVLQ